MKNKAQTQVITIVLISGIVISLVGTAYLWGVPLISKRTSISDFMASEDFIVKLDSKIVDLANRGAGTFSLTIPKGLIKVIDYGASSPDNNSIILDVLVSQPLISTDSNVVLKTSVLGENATYGEAEPRIITMSSKAYGSSYKLALKLHYRELDMKDESKGYMISLKSGTVSGITGANEIILSYKETQHVTRDGMDIALTIIQVDLA